MWPFKLFFCPTDGLGRLPFIYCIRRYLSVLAASSNIFFLLWSFLRFMFSDSVSSFGAVIGVLCLSIAASYAPFCLLDIFLSYSGVPLDADELFPFLESSLSSVINFPFIFYISDLKRCVISSVDGTSEIVL